MKNQFIVLEGLDGSGKTSVAHFLAETYGFKFIKTPDKVFEQIRDYVDKQDAYTKLMFYYASNFDASRKIEDYLKEGSVICDRYFYSTLIYFAHFTGHTIEESIALMEAFTNKLILPDKVVYLTISDDTRISRLKERNIVNGSTDAYFIKNIHRCHEMEKLYLEMMELMSSRISYVVIEAEERVEVTCAKIMQELQK